MKVIALEQIPGLVKNETYFVAEILDKTIFRITQNGFDVGWYYHSHFKEIPNEPTIQQNSDNSENGISASTCYSN